MIPPKRTPAPAHAPMIAPFTSVSSPELLCVAPGVVVGAGTDVEDEDENISAVVVLKVEERVWTGINDTKIVVRAKSDVTSLVSMASRVVELGVVEATRYPYSGSFVLMIVCISSVQIDWHTAETSPTNSVRRLSLWQGILANDLRDRAAVLHLAAMHSS